VPILAIEQTVQREQEVTEEQITVSREREREGGRGRGREREILAIELTAT
jgi:hypothetical protein